MCGRFTVKATWAELITLYRLTMDAPPHNLRPRYNVCPTDPVDVVTAEEGRRQLIPMRWGLVPRWWNKPLKELRAATFNARAETVETKPFFRDAFKRTRCLIPLGLSSFNLAIAIASWSKAFPSKSIRRSNGRSQ
jgi:putative SOS response-associated peptidase YedK